MKEKTYSVNLTLGQILLLTDLEQEVHQWMDYSEDFGVLTEKEKNLYNNAIALLQDIYNKTRGTDKC